MSASPSQFDVQPIDLGNGWTGRLLVKGDAPLPLPDLTDAIASHSKLATCNSNSPQQNAQDAWKSWLLTLVNDVHALPDCAILKFSKHSQVCQATLTGSDPPCTVILKQSRPGTFRLRLRPWFGQSRGRRSFDQALRLLGCGIPTAAPLAVIERRGSRPQSWLVTQAVPNPVDLDRIALAMLPATPPAHWRAIKNALIDKIAELFVRLEEHRLTHRDLKASNLLWTGWADAENGPTLWLVDVDGLAAITPRTRWQPHMRLAASLVGYQTITRTDYARLLKRYLARTPLDRCKGRPKTPDWKTIWSHLAPRIADYRKAARARKRHKLEGENH